MALWTLSPRGLTRAAQRLARDRSGASIIEYLVLLALLGLGSIATVKHLRQSVSGVATQVAEHVATLTPFEPGAGTAVPARDQGRELGAPIRPTGPGVLDPGDLDPHRPPSDFEGKVTWPNGVGYRVRLRSSRNTTLEPNGQSTVTLEVSRTSNHTAKAEGTRDEVVDGKRYKVASAKYEIFQGDGVSYRIKLPEAAYQRILRGEAPFPDPGDLSTLPDGSSVLLREEDLSATELAGSYRIFKLASRQTDSHGSAVGLEVRGDRVRVLAGPTESVSQLTVFGIGESRKVKDIKLGFEASFERTKSLRYYELAYADISATKGQAAFEEFMRSGSVPQSDQVGVREAGTVRKIDYDDASNVKLALTIGDQDFTSRLLASSATARNTEVLRPDGSRDMTWIIHEKGVGVFETKTIAPDGRETRRQSGLLLDAVDPSYGHVLGEAYGVRTEDKSYDLQLEMSQAEYTALRNRAIDAQKGKSLPTNNPVVEAILSHANADDFMADVKLRNDGPNNVSEGLIRLYAETMDRGPLPGRMQFYDDGR